MGMAAFDFTALVTYSSSHSNSCRSIDRSSRKNSFPGGSHSCSDRSLELGNREILSYWMVFNSLEMFMSYNVDVLVIDIRDGSLPVGTSGVIGVYEH